MKKIFISLLVSYTCQFAGRAQGLKIGDPCPPLVLDSVFNYKSGKLNLGDLKGKFVILQFWGTNCISCLEGFEKIDSLQKIFGDKLQFIMINSQGYEFTTRFFSKRKKLKIPAVPFVMGDTVLKNFFSPTKEISYNAWLDDNGILKYKSSDYDINSQTINSFLNGKEMQISPMASGRTKINPVINLEYENQIQYISYITKCIRGIQPSFSDSFRRKFIRISDPCVPVIYLYKKAYFIKDSFDYDRPGRTWLDLPSPNDYIEPTDYFLRKEWLNNHKYNYELILPRTMKGRVGNIMVQDLDQFFGLKSTVELKETECVILKRTGGQDLLRTKGGRPEFGLEKSGLNKTIEDSIRYIRNKPFRMLATRLQQWIEILKKIPFLDETGYSGNIDIAIEGQVIEKLELDELKTALEKYGLTLVKEKRFIKALVIRKSEL